MITGQMTKTELTEHYGVSRQTIYCWINRYEKQLREESRK
jgi:transposase